MQHSNWNTLSLQIEWQILQQWAHCQLHLDEAHVYGALLQHDLHHKRLVEADNVRMGQLLQSVRFILKLEVVTLLTYW